MDNWKPKLKLLSVLAATKELLLRSKEEGWADEKPDEMVLEINKTISYLIDPDQSIRPDIAKIMFAPTGPIQEIAMSNGWVDEYMALSAEFDDLEYLINKDKSEIL
jgi:hypothetical protein